MTDRPLNGFQRLLQGADFVMAALVLVWSADALVRFGVGTVVTALVYAYFLARLAMTLPRFGSVVLRSGPVLVYPALCLISTYWSVMPEMTAIASVQIGFTILIGLFVGFQFRLLTLARLVLFALGLTMVLSLANLGGAWGNAYSWEGGFLGIYTNKNALGQRGALLVLVCIFVLAADPSRSLRFVAACILGLTGYLLVVSKSATSILMSGLIGGSFAFLSAAIAHRALRPWLWLVGTVFIGAVLVTLISLEINPWVEVLAAFDKNTTLTGRTVLWEHGLARIAERPVLGYGAMAYWVSPDHAQEILLLRDEYGTTVAAFHSFVIELLVGLGPMGLVAMGLLIGSSVHAVWRYTVGPVRMWALWALALLVLLSLLGSSLFRQHEITLVLVVALGASARRDVLLGGGPAGVRSNASMLRQV